MAKLYPEQIYAFLVADGFRQEIGGKITILGAFCAGQILVASTTKFPAIFPLALCVQFKDGEGAFQAKFRLIDQTGKTIVDNHVIGTVSKTPSQGMQLIINLGMFTAAAPGNYKVQIMLDDRIYDEGFSIGVAPNPVTQLRPS